MARFTTVVESLGAGLALCLGLGAMGASLMGWINNIVGAVLFAAGMLIGVFWVVLRIWPMVFPTIPDLHKSFRESSTVWGMWYTGINVGSADLVRKYDSIKRVILLNPNSPLFETIVLDALNPVAEARDQVRALVKSVRQENVLNGKGIELRWHKDIGAHSLTIFDPERQSGRGFSERAWLVVEFAEEHRPSRRVNKKDNPKVFQDYVELFERCWNESSPLTEEDWVQWAS